MKKPILTLLLIILTISSGLDIISAESDKNNTLTATLEEENLKIKSEEDRTGEIVSASEDGHFNISFDDGYNGYCINYGDHEADKGNNFTVQDTDHAVNEKSGQSVGNELKTFFVNYYDTAMQDRVKTQHIIWHFTNDFNGWRVDSALIEEIKKASLEKVIPDHGATRKISNTAEMVFDFEVLESHDSDHQNFFAYRVTLREILEILENETMENTTQNTDLNNQTSNSTVNQTEEKLTKNNYSNSTENKTNLTPNTEKNNSTKEDSQNNKFENVSLKKHVTGYNYIPAIIILLFGLIIVTKYARD
nr:hypothetical protein [uncultured Methanobrevibacter sp.]